MVHVCLQTSIWRSRQPTPRRSGPLPTATQTRSQRSQRRAPCPSLPSSSLPARQASRFPRAHIRQDKTRRTTGMHARTQQTQSEHQRNETEARANETRRRDRKQARRGKARRGGGQGCVGEINAFIRRERPLSVAAERGNRLPACRWVLPPHSLSETLYAYKN